MEKRIFKKAHLVFEKHKETKKLEKELDKAYKKIGQLELERDFLSGILKNC